MKLNTATREVSSSGITQQNAFTIKASAKAFKILSDGLYSNKPLAIVRELAANAWDAHVEAGKADVPFEIKLPNAIDPSFGVKDYGTGLSHHALMHVYTTFFESPKTDSDDVIGCLGLGSKSPFSYTDSFTVISRHDGMKRTYTCYMDEHDMPTVALRGEINTTEPNGIEVKFAVKEEDFSRFAGVTANTLARFNPLPIVRGKADFEFKKIDHLLLGTGWALRSVKGDHNTDKTCFAIQGNIAYPIDRSALKIDDYQERSIYEMPFDLQFNIGELDVSASRESLSYDARTRANILAKMEQVKAEFAEKFQQEFDNCQTLWEATVKYRVLTRERYSNDGIRQILKASKIIWNGVEMKDTTLSAEKDYLKTPGLSFSGTGRSDLLDPGRWRRGRRLAKKPKLDKQSEIHVSPTAQALVAWDDTQRKHLPLIVQHAAREGDLPAFDSIYIIHTASEAERDDALEQLGHPPYILLSTLPDVPPEVKESMRRRYAPKKCFSYTKRGYSNGCVDNWSLTTADMNAGGVFVNMENYEVKRPNWVKGAYSSSPIFLMTNARNAGLLGVDEEIYGFNSTYSHLPKAKNGWVELHVEMKERVASVVDAKDLANYNHFEAFKGDFLFILLSALNHNNLFSKRTTSPLFRAAVNYETLRPFSNPRLAAIQWAVTYLDVKVRKVKSVVSLDGFQAKVFEKHPLLVNITKEFSEHDLRSNAGNILNNLITYIDR